MRPSSGSMVLDVLYQTVLLLAAEHGQIEERLGRAFIALREIDGEHLTGEAGGRLQSIRRELGEMYPDGCTPDGFDRERAVNVAMDIILLYDNLPRQ